MKARAEKMLAGEGSPRSAPTSGSLPRTDSASSSSGQTRGFTPEQEAGAKKILLAAKKSHYEVLGIARDADEDAIKRAYKKLALKFHPDKNSAPSAEAAFKAISTANDTLGDLQKREIYDQVGHDAAMNNNGMDGGGGGFPGGFHGFRRGGGGGVHVHEINPEDIFNLFFQGGVPGGMQGAFRTHMPQQRARPQYTEERRSGSFVMQLLQFLPIIALFVMSMSSLGGTGQPAYSFRQSNVHMEARKTGPNSVFRGVPYYVTPSFDRSFPPQSYSLQRLERDISLEYREILATECQKERQRRGVNIYKVTIFGFVKSSLNSLYSYIFNMLYLCRLNGAPKPTKRKRKIHRHQAVISINNYLRKKHLLIFRFHQLRMMVVFIVPFPYYYIFPMFVKLDDTLNLNVLGSPNFMPIFSALNKSHKNMKLFMFFFFKVISKHSFLIIYLHQKDLIVI